MVGRGPRDQSSGQKPRARLPEVLACPAALRFKRANGREAGRAGLPRLLLNRGLNPFLGGVLDECGSEHSKSSRGHFFLKNDPRYCVMDGVRWAGIWNVTVWRLFEVAITKLIL